MLFDGINVTTAVVVTGSVAVRSLLKTQS